jgi:hypothetical protein
MVKESKIALISLLLLSLFLFFLSQRSLIYGAGSDPRYTLIVSQSILENGTIALDGYAGDLIWGEPANFAQNFNIIERNGRFYNYFPAGPSLLSVPFVAVARLVGWDMRQAADNINAQRLLSSLSLVALLWLMFGIARAFLPWQPSLLITAVSLFGSSLISTLGVALWSINFSVLAIACALLLLVRREMGLDETVHPVLLGICLFLAYFARAAAAAFILPLFIYLAYASWAASGVDRVRRLRELLGTAVTAALLLALFLLWSRLTFGSWLPIYYSVARLQVARSSVWTALLGVLFSSGRGLFIYAPGTILLLVGLRWLWRQPLAWLCWGWISLHLLVLLRGTQWWGGDAFGPRILTELMLALFLLTLLGWQWLRQAKTARLRRGVAAAYLLLGLFGIWLHTVQGLFNDSTALWNAVASHEPVPPFTEPLGDLFSWQYPQFAANNQMLCRMAETRTRQIVTERSVLRPYQWGEPIVFGVDTAVTVRNIPPPGSSPAALIGWAPVDNDRAPVRELFCDQAAVLFLLEDVPEDAIELQLRAAAIGEQRVTLRLNGTLIGETIFVQQPKMVGETAVFSLNPAQFLPNQTNELQLSLSDIVPSPNPDPSRLRLAIEFITLSPESLSEKE